MTEIPGEAGDIFPLSCAPLTRTRGAGLRWQCGPSPCSEEPLCFVLRWGCYRLRREPRDQAPNVTAGRGLEGLRGLVEGRAAKLSPEGRGAGQARRMAEHSRKSPDREQHLPQATGRRGPQSVGEGGAFCLAPRQSDGERESWPNEQGLRKEQLVRDQDRPPSPPPRPCG